MRPSIGCPAYRCGMEGNDRTKYLIPFLVTMVAVIVILAVVIVVLFTSVDTLI
jgi:hypothetical protein